MSSESLLWRVHGSQRRPPAPGGERAYRCRLGKDRSPRPSRRSARRLGASLENGLLQVDLLRVVPEAMKPRAIPITTAKKVVLEGKAAKIAA
jgi:hypothetical protein